MSSLYQQQSAMRVKQKPRTGPKVIVSDPIAEGQLRIRIWYMWLKGCDERELSRNSGRPISWVRNWIDDGCKLL